MDFCMMPPTEDFNVDGPFIFMIVLNRSILFQARIVDPTL